MTTSQLNGASQAWTTTAGAEDDAEQELVEKETAADGKEGPTKTQKKKQAKKKSAFRKEMIEKMRERNASAVKGPADMDLEFLDEI